MNHINDINDAIRNNDINSIKQFIQNGIINSDNYKGIIILNVVRYGRPIILEILLKRFGVCDNVELLIHCNPYITKMLIHYGINPNVVDSYGYNALHYLSNIRCNLAVVKILLEAGTDPLKLNRQGKTPLDLARESGRKDLVELITTYIANLSPPKKPFLVMGKRSRLSSSIKIISNNKRKKMPKPVKSRSHSVKRVSFKRGTNSPKGGKPIRKIRK
jgi:hypothetical protein